ncbi:MAG: hypothetical protein WBC87_26000, partial [Pseudolabrys sp.]
PAFGGPADIPKSELLRIEDRTGSRKFVEPVDQLGIERKRYKRIRNTSFLPSRSRRALAHKKGFDRAP